MNDINEKFNNVENNEDTMKKIAMEQNNENTLNQFVKSRDTLRSSYRSIRSLFKHFNKPIPDSLYVILNGADEVCNSLDTAIKEFEKIMNKNGEKRFSAMLNATLISVESDTYNRIIIQLFQIYKNKFDSELISKFSSENIVETLKKEQERIDRESKEFEAMKSNYTDRKNEINNDNIIYNNIDIDKNITNENKDDSNYV